MLTFTVEELIRFLSNWTMTFFEGAKRSGDIVFSRYYSFFKHPVLVREHQVESLYVMVQNRDSSDNKKPSFSRFAKWEFGGFIVDSKTIYMASKPVKALLQSSDFIDDMDVFEKLDSIRIPLFRKNIPADPAMFQDKYPGIWLTTDNEKSHRHCSWFRLELPNDTNDIVMGHLYAGDDDMETDQPLAIIADGIRADGDESKRILWVDEDVTCVKSMNDDYLNRQKAITEKQLSDLSSGIFLQNFDYIVYGKRLASKSENTVEFVENTIVSHNKQELEVVASGMEAMGLSVETGYFDPDDESSVDVPKQLIGFHYVVLKKKV